LSDFRVPILSHHLKMKIKELQPKISSWIIDKININGKIHSKKKKIFEEIHSNLFQEKHFNLN